MPIGEAANKALNKSSGPFSSLFGASDFLIILLILIPFIFHQLLLKWSVFIKKCFKIICPAKQKH